MRPIHSVAALLAVLLAAAPAAAQMRPQPQPQQLPQSRTPGGEVTERLVLTPPQGWQSGGTGSGPGVITTQLFPPGQTSENWTEMLTVQVIGDPRAEHRDHVQRVVEASRVSCEASGPSPIAEGQTNGFPVATLTVTCTKGRQSGMGGLLAVKAIRGTSALYVIERVWRGPPFERNEAAPVPPGMLQEWAGFMRNVSVCDTAGTQHPCPK